jgi:MFS family permease
VNQVSAMTATHSDRMGWTAMALVALAMYGNFYVYDSIAPVAEMLSSQLGFSDTQIGTLNAIYSIPNVVLVLVGGILVDRYGIGRMGAITAGICLLGALLTAATPDFHLMATGRLLYGIGAETFNIAALAAVALWFPIRYTALAMGLTLAMGRMGSLSADLSPTWLPAVYAAGWQPPLMLSALIAGTSFAAALVYWWYERHAGIAASRTSQASDGAFRWRDVLQFSPAYWTLVALCVLWYAGILAFRSTFSIKYFQHVFGLPLDEAGQMNSVIFLTSIVSTPLLGWLCDRTGRYSAILVAGSFLLPAAFFWLQFVGSNPHVGMVLIGMSYSLVGAALWPMSSKLVETARYGTALGAMWVLQNAAIAGSNIVAGWLNDVNGAGASNPGGYGAMMIFFLACSSLGFFATLLLWRLVPGRIGDQR